MINERLGGVEQRSRKGEGGGREILLHVSSMGMCRPIILHYYGFFFVLLPFILIWSEIRYAVKSVLGRHLRDPCWCPLNTGCPLKTGSLRIRLKRVISILVSVRRP